MKNNSNDNRFCIKDHVAQYEVAQEALKVKNCQFKILYPVRIKGKPRHVEGKDRKSVTFRHV